jgi:hypothetical protein
MDVSNSISQSIADRIGDLIHNKFYELAAQRIGFQDIGVLAGIVMTSNSDISTARVILLQIWTQRNNS